MQEASPTAVSRRDLTLLWLISSHTSLLIAANAGGAKVIALGWGLTASATVFPYALTLPLCDVINELGGKRIARMAVDIGLVGLVLAVLFYQLSIVAPAAPFFANQAGYAATLGGGPRLLVGGLAGYWLGNRVDVWAFGVIRRLTGERWFWLRKNGSTLVSQAVDTLVFVVVAFGDSVPIVGVVVGQYLLKLAIAASATPVSYLAIALVRRFWRRSAQAD